MPRWTLELLQKGLTKWEEEKGGEGRKGTERIVLKERVDVKEKGVDQKEECVYVLKRF